MLISIIKIDISIIDSRVHYRPFLISILMIRVLRVIASNAQMYWIDAIIDDQ